MSQAGILSDKTTGATDIEVLTGDSGGQVGPSLVSGKYNINLLGGNGIDVVGTPGTSTLTFSNLRDVARYVVAPTAGQAGYISVQDAIDQAVTDGASSATPATIWIWPGTYTEDLTLKPYVNLSAASDPSTEDGALIVGNAIYANPSTGNLSINNVGFKSNNSNAAISFQSTATSLVHLQSVSIDADVGIGLECTGSGMTVNCSIGSLMASSGGKCKNITDGFVEFFSGVSTYVDTASTVSGGILRLVGCDLIDSFSVTGGQIQCLSSIIDGLNTECFTVGALGTVISVQCVLSSNAVSGYFATGTGNFLYSSIVPPSNSQINPLLTTATFTIVTGNLSFDGGITTLSSDGQLWIGSGSGAPAPATLTAGSGISITNGANSISISSTGIGLTWNSISASQTLAIKNGYICASPGGALSLALPAISSLGDAISITLDGATSFTVTQSAGQQISIGNLSTTAGVGGSLSSTQQGDSITMICSVANLKWNVLSSMGNPTIV